MASSCCSMTVTAVRLARNRGCYGSSTGDLDHDGLRSCSAAKVAFPNRDTYFGGYQADSKAGTGLYVFANGGAYIGQYQGGKRQGQGLMILPDGGLYRGQFAADKFDGLVSVLSLAWGLLLLWTMKRGLLCTAIAAL